MKLIPAERKPLLIGIALFLLTLGWVFFLDQLTITPDSLLRSVGDVDNLLLLASVPFVGFALLFTATIGIITAYSDREERGRVYVVSIAPIVLATGMGALLFNHFAQWYPLALFFFGSIPLMIETARLKRMELKNFPVARSSFAGAQRGLQIVGIGVLVTLAITAMPQNATLYQGFEDSLFAGKIVQQVNVEKLTTDFLIATQRNTLSQIINTDSFQKLRTSESPDDIEFVALMDDTLANVNSATYREQINQQVRNQQQQIDPTALVDQLQQTIPGYEMLKTNYWALAAFLGSLVYMLAAFLILQPLSAVMGTLIYHYVPLDGNDDPVLARKKESSTGLWGIPSAPMTVRTDTVTGWSAPPSAASADISVEPAQAPAPVVPDYTHTDETPAA